MSLLDYTAVELAAKIKAGETTATEAMLLGKRYLMHVQSWGFQHRKQPPCCERERQIV